MSGLRDGWLRAGVWVVMLTAMTLAAGRAAARSEGEAAEVAAAGVAEMTSDEPAPTTQPALAVALWRCELATTGQCFSGGFLADARRRGGVHVAPVFTDVRLGEAEVFDHPLAVLSGDSPLLLTETETLHLRQFIEAGGCLIASANCTSEAFDASFRGLIGALWPRAALTRLGPDHPVFHGVYEIDGLRGQKVGGDPHLLGLELGGRLAVLYAPNGLNATGELGRECCCCGGDELANARPVLVNTLVWVLTGEGAAVGTDGSAVAPSADESGDERVHEDAGQVAAP